jgi:hypothetical protein
MGSTTVRKAQRQRLCRAFPFEFWGLSNIFQQENGYFPQNLQFKFLVSGGCAEVSNLDEIEYFKHCLTSFCYIGDLDTV